MGRKVSIGNLVLDNSLMIRKRLDQDAISRYRELYKNGYSKALIVQKGTLKLLDGYHRLQAARLAGLKEVWVEERDVQDNELLCEVIRFNQRHGVPLSTEERNELIYRLYYECGKTQEQIAQLTGLSQQGVSKILSKVTTTTGGKVDKINGDKRIRLQDEDMPVVARLLLAGASHQEVAQQFGVARSTLTTRWNEFRDKVLHCYQEGHLKQEVAEKFRLTREEVDLILQQFGDPVNFQPVLVKSMSF